MPVDGDGLPRSVMAPVTNVEDEAGVGSGGDRVLPAVATWPGARQRTAVCALADTVRLGQGGDTSWRDAGVVAATEALHTCAVSCTDGWAALTAAAAAGGDCEDAVFEEFGAGAKEVPLRSDLAAWWFEGDSEAGATSVLAVPPLMEVFWSSEEEDETEGNAAAVKGRVSEPGGAGAPDDAEMAGDGAAIETNDNPQLVEARRLLEDLQTGAGVEEAVVASLVAVARGNPGEDGAFSSLLRDTVHSSSDLALRVMEVVQSGDTLAIKAAHVMLRELLLPLYTSSDGPVSRRVTEVSALCVPLYPKAAVDSLLLPLYKHHDMSPTVGSVSCEQEAASNRLDSPPFQSIVKLVKLLPPMQVEDFAAGAAAAPVDALGEAHVVVLKQLVSMTQLRLSSRTASNLVTMFDGLAHRKSFQRSTVFAAAVSTFVNKHKAHATNNREALVSLLMRCKSFPAKAALKKLA